MSHRQPYTYEFASSSSHGILKDVPPIPGVPPQLPVSHKTSSPVQRVPSERTPLIANDEDEESEEDCEVEEPSQHFTSRIIHNTTGYSNQPGAVSYAHKSTDVSLWLENTGSVARDHLASERTFLAYVRTSLSIASSGVALAQILSIAQYFSDDEIHKRYERRIETWARPLGATAVLIALLVLAIGIARYFAVQSALVRGRFPVARIGVTVMATLFGSLIVATFFVLMNVQLPAILNLHL